MLRLIENSILPRNDDHVIADILRRLNPWERGDNLTRRLVAAVCREIWPQAALVYVGGHHVAVHLHATHNEDRHLLIVSDAPDWW